MFFIPIFISGFCTITIGLLSLRLLAPYFGNSIIVQTILVVLFLSYLICGYCAGDKIGKATLCGYNACSTRALSLNFLNFLYSKISNSTAKGTIAYSFIFAGIFLVFDIPVSKWILKIFSEFSTIKGTIFCSILFFSIPIFLLGMIVPLSESIFSIKKDITTSTTGKTFATYGCALIFGIIITSFVFIPYLGVYKSLIVVSLISFATGFLFYSFNSTITIFIVLCSSLLYYTSYIAENNIVLKGNILIEKETQYQLVQAIKKSDNISFHINRHKNPAVIIPIKEKLITGEHWDYFNLPLLLRPLAKRVLFIGIGSLCNIRQYSSYPELKIDLVEKDWQMLELAKKFLPVSLLDSGTIHFYADDARRFLAESQNNNIKKYDIIAIDMFWNGVGIPFHFATAEFFRSIYQHLTIDGIFIVNVRALKEPILNSMRFSFSSIYTLDLGNENLVVLGMKRGINEEELPSIILNCPSLLKPTLLHFINNYDYYKFVGGDFFTDDDAPVEFKEIIFEELGSG